jgi:hypothetical protein
MRSKKTHVVRALCGPDDTWPLPLELMVLIIEFSHHAQFGSRICHYFLFFPFKNKRFLN